MVSLYLFSYAFGLSSSININPVIVKMFKTSKSVNLSYTDEDELRVIETCLNK